MDYLWDLDPAIIKGKVSSAPAGVHWDWKKLVHLLRKVNLMEQAVVDHLGSGVTQGSSIGEGQDEAEERPSTLPDVPHGLRNRCRIMKIVRDIEERLEKGRQGGMEDQGEKSAVTSSDLTKTPTSNSPFNSS